MIRSLNYPYTVHRATLSNGCNMAYVDEGKGEQTILFIHGLATYALCWQKNIEQLKQHYRCIAVDLPGNGLSDRGEYDYGINFFSGCIFDFIKKLKLKNLIIAGHSMGGQIAMNMLANEPTVAEKLILCAPAGFETFTSFERTMYKSGISFFDLFSTDENSLRQTIMSSFYHYKSESGDMADELAELMRMYPIKQYRAMIDGCVHGMLNEAVHDRLHLVQQPTLVMFGEYDALIPNKLIHPTSTKQLAMDGVKKMPNAKLHMIPNCGHFLQIEKAEEVNKHIREFIK